MFKDIVGLFSSRSGVSIYKMVSFYIYFFLTISLLSNHNIKNRHINITILKLDTNNTYSDLFKNTFQEFFACSMKSRDSFLTKWSCVLRNGVNIFVSDIKFTVLI